MFKSRGWEKWRGILKFSGCWDECAVVMVQWLKRHRRWRRNNGAHDHFWDSSTDHQGGDVQRDLDNGFTDTTQTELSHSLD